MYTLADHPISKGRVGYMHEKHEWVKYSYYARKSVHIIKFIKFALKSNTYEL